MADPGEGPQGARLPLFLDQTEAQRAEKKCFETRSASAMSFRDTLGYNGTNRSFSLDGT